MAEATVREVIEILTRSASSLPEGLDAVFELGICDGQNLQLINDVDVDPFLFVKMTANPPAPGPGSVLMCGHWHPGESPGEVRRGQASNADEELRKLTEGDQGSTPQ